MIKIQPQLMEQGVQLCAIGNGTPLMAEDFVHQFNIPFPVYTDPKRKTYAHMGFKRSLGFGLSSIKNASRAIQGGHKQGPVHGDPWQQGGEALFNTNGEILWAHSADKVGSHSTPDRILGAIKTALSGK